MSIEELNEIVSSLAKIREKIDEGHIRNVIIDPWDVPVIRLSEGAFKSLFSEFFIDRSSFDKCDSLYVLMDGIKIHCMIDKGDQIWE